MTPWSLGIKIITTGKFIILIEVRQVKILLRQIFFYGMVVNYFFFFLSQKSNENFFFIILLFLSLIKIFKGLKILKQKKKFVYFYFLIKQKHR